MRSPADLRPVLERAARAAAFVALGWLLWLVAARPGARGRATGPSHDLAPQLAGRASRAAVPVYARGKFTGQATSHVFSPILKQYIALATVEEQHSHTGSRVLMECTVEYERHAVGAQVAALPFYNPPWKRG